MAPVISDDILPLAFVETFAQERARLEKLKAEDPIGLQDVLCTSDALLEAVKQGDVEELRSVVANAEPGELLQARVVQAFVLALKATSLTIVKEMVQWGFPLDLDHVSQSLHLICEVTTRDNFSDAWRIIELLVQGENPGGNLIVDTPRVADGWTPLCIACADACLPLVFKLLELKADPNVITRRKETPVMLVRETRPTDSEEQQEARGIISNMLRSYGGQGSAKAALAYLRGERNVETHAEAGSPDGHAPSLVTVTTSNAVSGEEQQPKPKREANFSDDCAGPTCHSLGGAGGYPETKLPSVAD